MNFNWEHEAKWDSFCFFYILNTYVGGHSAQDISTR